MHHYTKLIILLTILWNTTSMPPLSAEENFIQHTVVKGDGFYNLSKRYNITIDDLITLNPQLKEGLKKGQLIRIPVRTTAATTAAQPSRVSNAATPNKKGEPRTHVVQPKETLYGVAKQYGLNTQQLIAYNPGLSPATFQIGRTIYVSPNTGDAAPTNAPTATSATPHAATSVALTPPPVPQPNARFERATTRHHLKAALLLPFNMDSSSPESIENRNRFLDYYRGVLLAVDSLKTLGRNIELTVIDTRNNLTVIDSLVSHDSLREMDFVIGPALSEQALYLALYLSTNRIPMVIPFSSKMQIPIEGLTSYQVNPPAHILNARASRLLNRLIPEGSNVIFLSNAHYKGDKAEFAQQLRSEFSAAGIHYSTYKYTLDTIATLKKWLNPDVENFIITETSNVKELSSLLPNLQTIKALNPQYNISLVGYPEWQTFFAQLREPFFALNTYIFTSFYADTENPTVKNINKKYTTLFHQFPLPTYPHYALLGFDTGLFFFNAAYKSFTSTSTHQGLQTVFEFVPADKGQFINHKVFIVNFSNQLEVIRR